MKEENFINKSLRSTKGKFDHPIMGKECFSCTGSGRGATELFLELRHATIKTFIIEREKTKRITLVLAAALVISATLIVLFAPEGRETLSFYIAGILSVISAGAIGYDHFSAKSKTFEIIASSQKNCLNKQHKN